MGKPYSITITDGSGTANILNDTYSVSASAVGYDETSIDPKSLSVVEGTNSYNLTVGATGTLTIHISEQGTASGTPIVGAKLIRTDKNGTPFGNELESSSEGLVIFNNVPYASNDAPSVYYKQTTGDGTHTFSEQVYEIKLTTQTLTVELANPLPTARTINLYDSNYSNLPIESATITLS